MVLQLGGFRGKHRGAAGLDSIGRAAGLASPGPVVADVHGRLSGLLRHIPVGQAAPNVSPAHRGKLAVGGRRFDCFAACFDAIPVCLPRKLV